MTRRTRRGPALIALPLAAALLACGDRPSPGADPPDGVAVQAAALRALFVARERAAGLVLWNDPARPGPTFELLGRAPAGAPLPTAREVGVAVATEHAASLDALFAAHPDGWAAFFRRHAGAGGLVELSAPVLAGDSATLWVGRACGEHCRQAWQVVLRRAPSDTGWRAVRVTPRRVPGA